MSKTDNQKIKSNFADTSKVPGAFIYSNDLDESFFSYLNDLKKIELPSGADKDDLIRQFDETMNVFREQLFSFAPAVTDFINILNDIIEGKISKEDVFFHNTIICDGYGRPVFLISCVINRRKRITGRKRS